MRKTLYIFISILLLIYVCLPSPQFPNPPPDAVQSREEGDMEDTSVRRAYFTDFTRSEVLAYYQSQFIVNFLGWKIPTYRLNYPPEDSQTLIRDQTRTTFLEEIVYPLRESFFVNGLEPKQAKDDIWYKGIHYRQKIIVKYYRSGFPVRIIVSLLIIAIAPLVHSETKRVIREIKGIRRNRD